MSTPPITATVALCGSMTHFARMRQIAKDLIEQNISVLIPENEKLLRDQLPESAFREYKRRVSHQYFGLIRKRDVFCILVVNEPKHGTIDYIGANTFAEIAVAVNARKKIFLLNGIPDDFRDELEAWGAIPLNGRLEPLIATVNSETNRAVQLKLEGISC